MAHRYPGKVRPYSMKNAGAALCRYISISTHMSHIIIIKAVFGRLPIASLTAFAIVPRTVFSSLDWSANIYTNVTARNIASIVMMIINSVAAFDPDP